MTFSKSYDCDHMHNAGKVRKTCLYCGDFFITPTPQLQYCSERCRAMHLEEKRKIDEEWKKASTPLEIGKRKPEGILKEVKR